VTDIKIDYKPSQVVLYAPPLASTMGRSELEAAAALVVRVCQARGDQWQSVPWSLVGEVMREDMAANREPFAKLVRNPFFRPDATALAAAGYCTIVDGAVTLTEKAMVAMARWVRAEPTGDAVST
jgi:hypothetical protein